MGALLDEVQSILTTEAGYKKGDLSLMENEDLVLSIKYWTKRTGESK